MRSLSHSPSDSRIRSTSRPDSVLVSSPSCTDTNVPPATLMRSIAARPEISERPKRSTLATTIPSEIPLSTRRGTVSNTGRSPRPPDSSSSSKTSSICAPRIAAQRSITSRCTSGEMNRSPRRPPTCDTRTYPSTERCSPPNTIGTLARGRGDTTRPPSSHGGRGTIRRTSRSSGIQSRIAEPTERLRCPPNLPTLDLDEPAARAKDPHVVRHRRQRQPERLRESASRPAGIPVRRWRKHPLEDR
jgi:hypothetical protein